jgi:hypothetical protein
MTSAVRFTTMALSSLAALGLAAAAVAQSGANVASSSMPEVRDSRTGKDVNPDPNPNAYVNRAFDPRDQGATVRGVIVQHPRANLMGSVPIAAGPSVPIVTIDAPSLQAIPGQRWLTVLYVSNNSAATVEAMVGCTFTNNDQKVEDVRVMVPPAGPGERLGVPVRGPRTDIFVDRVTCNVLAPI